MPNRTTDLSRKGGGCLYTSIVASAALTNTTTATAMDSYTIPADVLKAGDVLEFFAQGIATATNSTDTLQVQVKIGSSVLADTDALDVADNGIWVIHGFVTIRTDGPSGTLVAGGYVDIGVNGTTTVKMDILASTAVDTTAALAVTVVGTWSVASASNSCRNDQFVLKLHRPVTFD
jgi:hypothetical protein